MTDKLTIQDCRDAGFCIHPGVKKACETYGINFRLLVKAGIPLAEVESLPDANVVRAVSIAKKRIARDGK